MVNGSVCCSGWVLFLTSAYTNMQNDFNDMPILQTVKFKLFKSS